MRCKVQTDDNQKEIRRVQKYAREMQGIIETKATDKRVDEVDSKFKDYCSYKDLKLLYKKVVPAVKGFEANLVEFGKDMEQTKEIVKRFDEVILEKASKISLEAVDQKFELYVKKEQYEGDHNKISEFQNNTQGSIKDLSSGIEQLTQKVDVEIKLAVKKATNYLSNELKKNSGKGYVNKEAVLEMISDKIDKVELLSLLEFKSNKHDMETNMNAVETLHKQIQNVLVIILEILTNTLDEDQNNLDSEKTRLEKRQQILTYAMSIARWVHKFNPKITTNFDMTYNEEEYTLLSKYTSRHKPSHNRRTSINMK